MRHVLVATPMMVTNRVFIGTWYTWEEESGTKIIMSSSKGNEAYYEKHKDKHGSAVIANYVVAYNKITPCEGGMEILQVSQMDPAGMLPGFIKTKMSQRMGMNLFYVVDFLMTGNLPPAPF